MCSSDLDEDYNSPFTIDELKEALGKAHDSAPGPDHVHYQLLRHLPEVCLEVLLVAFNRIWLQGNFPDSWRNAIVIPIPKPGRDPCEAGNQRPISLTSCVCKTMERMINERLVYYLEINNLITEVQCGFRKNRSTIDHLIRLESLIKDAFINKERVVSIFFDLEKAYDTTWKHGILKDLFEMGLRGHLANFIANFLENRQF